MLTEEEFEKLATRIASRINTTPTARELTRQLGPEYVSYRKAGGPTPAPYLEGHRAIQLANEILGYNGWSSEIRERKTEHLNVKSGVQICCSVLMRVTLSNGSFREDVGYGTVQRGNNIVVDLEKAGKEAATDALKRVLRQFGESLGNCLYDKSYMNQLKAITAVTQEMDVDNLRRPKRAPSEREPEEEETPKSKTLKSDRRVTAPGHNSAKEAPKPSTSNPIEAELAAAPMQHQPKPLTPPTKYHNTPTRMSIAAAKALEPDFMLSSSPPEAPKSTKKPMAAPGFLSAGALERFDESHEFGPDVSFDVSVELPTLSTVRQDKTEGVRRADAGRA